jgi:hypothetical protein
MTMAVHFRQSMTMAVHFRQSMTMAVHFRQSMTKIDLCRTNWSRFHETIAAKTYE